MYSRRNFRRKYPSKTSRRYPRRSRPITYGQIGTKLMRDVSWLKSVINVEKKYIDTSISNQSATDSGTLVLLNGCATGDTASTRDGQSIKVSSIEIRGYIKINGSATSTDAKIAVLIDSQANAAAPTISNIWSSADPNALRLIGTGTRFQVIHTRNITLSANGTEIVHFKLFKKLNFHTKFNTGSAGTIADIVTNSLYFFYSSSEPTNYPSLSAQLRIRFIDN